MGFMHSVTERYFYQLYHKNQNNHIEKIINNMILNFQGEELKHFCPSVFIFLATILPAVWILELKTDRRELLCLTIENFQGKYNLIILMRSKFGNKKLHVLYEKRTYSVLI